MTAHSHPPWSDNTITASQDVVYAMSTSSTNSDVGTFDDETATDKSVIDLYSGDDFGSGSDGKKKLRGLNALPQDVREKVVRGFLGYCVSLLVTWH